MQSINENKRGGWGCDAEYWGEFFEKNEKINHLFLGRD